jgi:hypothetical protein
MRFVFSESLKDAYREHGGPGALGLWGRILLDTAHSLAIQHFDHLKGELSMETKSPNNRVHMRNILLIALATGLILLIPLAAMQFTRSVDWSLFDFIAAGGLLFGAGLAFEWIASRVSVGWYRAGAAVAVGTALLLVWVNLAVGLIGSEDNPANAIYIGVLAVAGLGALIARFRPLGMQRAAYAAALAQALVTGIALAAGLGNAAGSSTFEIVGVNSFFIALWLAAALLFGRAHAALGGEE